MMGQNVSDEFHGSRMHGRKNGTLILYDLYGTFRGGFEYHIDPINDAHVIFYCYLIPSKVMKNYTKNECTLEMILVVEFTKNGAPLN